MLHLFIFSTIVLSEVPLRNCCTKMNYLWLQDVLRGRLSGGESQWLRRALEVRQVLIVIRYLAILMTYFRFRKVAGCENHVFPGCSSPLFVEKLPFLPEPGSFPRIFYISLETTISKSFRPIFILFETLFLYGGHSRTMVKYSFVRQSESDDDREAGLHEGADVLALRLVISQFDDFEKLSEEKKFLDSLFLLVEPFQIVRGRRSRRLRGLHRLSFLPGTVVLRGF